MIMTTKIIETTDFQKVLLSIDSDALARKETLDAENLKLINDISIALNIDFVRDVDSNLGVINKETVLAKFEMTENLTYILAQLIKAFSSERYAGYKSGSYVGLDNALKDIKYEDGTDAILGTQIYTTTGTAGIAQPYIWADDYTKLETELKSTIIETLFKNMSLGILVITDPPQTLPVGVVEYQEDYIVDENSQVIETFAYYSCVERSYKMKVVYYLDEEANFVEASVGGAIDAYVKATFNTLYNRPAKDFHYQDFSAMSIDLAGVKRVDIILLDDNDAEVANNTDLPMDYYEVVTFSEISSEVAPAALSPVIKSAKAKR